MNKSINKLFLFVFFNVLLIILTSCSSISDPEKEGKIQDSIISTRKMIDILTDIHLADAALKIKQNQNKDIKGDAELYYSMIFKKYNITKNEFKKSLDYYINNPQKLEFIYSEVINSMIQIQSLLVPSENISQSSPHIRRLSDKFNLLLNDTL